MAWLEPDKNGIYHVCLRYGGRRFKKSARTRDRTKAGRLRARVEENLELVERGHLLLPDDAQLLTFLASDGRLARKPSGQSDTSCTKRTLGRASSSPDSQSPWATVAASRCSETSRTAIGYSPSI